MTSDATASVMVPVRPVRPAAGYQGGKKNLARRICALIDRTPHDGYAEPFVGMGGIFLRRSTRPKVEAINDISADVANFFRVLQEHYPYFVDMLRFRVASRNEFERLAALPAERLTDLQRAARFLYLQRLAFGGKVAGRNFGVSSSQSSASNKPHDRGATKCYARWCADHQPAGAPQRQRGDHPCGRGGRVLHRDQAWRAGRPRHPRPRDRPSAGEGG